MRLTKKYWKDEIFKIKWIELGGQLDVEDEGVGGILGVYLGVRMNQ